MLSIIKNFLGYTIDKDIGIVHTSFDYNLQYLLKNKSNIQSQLSINTESLYFLLIICCLNKTENIIDNDTMNEWIHTQPFLKQIIYNPILNKPKEKKIYGLEWTGNSCYLDSVLVSLFASSSPFIDKNMLLKDIESLKNENLRFRCYNSLPIDEDLKQRKKIQDELKKIKDSIYSNKIEDCSSLRKAISTCRAQQEFHGRGTQDTGEFLVYLFDLFQIDTATLIRYTFLKNDDEKPILVRKVETEKETPVIDIYQGTLKDLSKYEIYPVDSFIKQTEKATFDEKNLAKHEGKTYKYRIEINKKISPEFMVFRAHRLGPDKFYQKMLYPTPYLFTLHSILTLSAIVIYTGSSHYVCVFCIDSIWYYYNDMKSKKVKKLGRFQDMIENTPYNPITHGVLYIYKK